MTARLTTTRDGFGYTRFLTCYQDSFAPTSARLEPTAPLAGRVIVAEGAEAADAERAKHRARNRSLVHGPPDSVRGYTTTWTPSTSTRNQRGPPP